MTAWLVAGLPGKMMPAQMPQNPSPMTDQTRVHRRVPQSEVRGERWKLSVGELLVTGRGRRATPLVVHFHGAPWLAEWSAARWKRHCAVLSVNLGAGSAVYARPFADPARFGQLLEEAVRAASLEFRPVVVTSFSAGYGAVREILRHRANRDRIDALVLADSLHAGYAPEGQPGPLAAESLSPFVDFAREAAAGRKRMILTHSEIFPGTFASTTETADFLLEALHLKRVPVLKWGPGGMQQLSAARAGRFEALGFAGNTAPDHLDHFHALEHWLRRLRM